MLTVRMAKRVWLTLLVGVAVSCPAQVSAGTISVVHSFNPGVVPEGPSSPLIQAADGNFYGVSQYGGWQQSSSGVFFKLTTAGVVTVLHTFAVADGSNPVDDLALGPDGSFYGTTG